MKHPRARAAEICHSPKVAAKETGLTIAEVKAIRAKQDARRSNRPIDRFDRPFETTIDRLKAKRDRDERNRKWELERQFAEKEKMRREGIRRSLLAFARIARAKELRVYKSVGRDKTVSSYYIDLPNGRRLRISDHHLPATAKREFMAQQHGRDYYDGYHGPELIIEEPKREEWLKRALALFIGGRQI